MQVSKQLLILHVQYSPLLTSHTHGIFCVAPRNFSRGKTKNYVWHSELPCVEKGFATPRNYHSHSHCHVWLILKAMPRAVTHDEETHYTHCFEAYLHCIIN